MTNFKSIATGLEIAMYPPTGQLLWTGDFDTGDESQWDYIHRYTTDRFRVTAAADGVTPREGSHLARVECRLDECAPWTPEPGCERNVAMAQKNSVPTVGLGSDIYSGFSVYLPNDYQPTYVGGDNYGNNFFEWHADTDSQIQAPTHFGVNGGTGEYFIDLHTHPTDWNPIVLEDVGTIIKGRWVDFVLRVLWKNDSTGKYEFWIDGSKVFTWTGRTWGNATYEGPQYIYPMFGLYRSNAPFTNVIYIDALKVGTSYEVVQP